MELASYPICFVFLELCGISYEFLKLKLQRALKSPTSLNVHNLYIVGITKKQHSQRVYISGGGQF